MKNLLVVLLLMMSFSAFAQEIPPPLPPPAPSQGTKIVYPPDTSKDEVLVFAEEMPQFPGGEQAFQKYLKKSIHYPDSALKYGREGTVYVYFEVNKNGSIQSVRCMRGVSNAPELCEEAVRVIREMPDWEPGKMNRKNVTVGMTVPIRFTLH